MDRLVQAKRIAIIGTSGSGKTYIGSRLAKSLGVPFIDLDELYWLPGWQVRSEDEFIEKVNEQLSIEEWIVSGNYSSARSIVWPKADLIIWLDLPLYLCLWRTLKRSIRRLFTGEVSCNGNRETLGRLFSSNSILIWVWKTHARRKQAYQAHFDSCKDAARFIRLTNNKEVKELLSCAE